MADLHAGRSGSGWRKQGARARQAFVASLPNSKENVDHRHTATHCNNLKVLMCSRTSLYTSATSTLYIER